jgi:hypothetical protein
MASEQGDPKSDDQSVIRRRENSQNWARLVAQVWADDQLKQRLLTNPAAVLKEFGATIPAGMEVRVVENTDKVVHLTLPAKPLGDVTELTAGQLDGVVGGFCTCRSCSTGEPDCLIIGPVTILRRA